MTVGLDTSVVLRLLTGQPAAQAVVAVAFLDDLQRRGDRAVLSDLVVAETYFALQYHYGVKKSDALGALHRLFEDGEIEATGGAGEVLATRGIAAAKPGFVDRLIHRAYVTNGGGMATFERAAAKLSAVVVLGR